MSLLKSIALAMISPASLALILALIGLLLHKLGKRRNASIFYIMAASWLLVFSQPYVSDLLVYPLEHGALSNNVNHTPEAAKNIDFIVPLACFYQTNGHAPEVSRWSECSLKRQLMANQLARQYGATLVLTGGNFLMDKDVNYALQAENLHKSFDFPPAQLLTVGKGKTTRQELQSIIEIVNDKNVIIVTSATHSYRAGALAGALGINAQIVSVNFHSSGELAPYLSMPSVHSLTKTRHALYEYFAILKYKFEAQ